MFDGTSKIFEYVKRKDAVVIIPSQKNKIIALKQKQPHTGWFYCTPSGRMDIKGEKPLECAKRELMEETGMVSEHWKLWKKIKHRGKVKNTIYIYIAQNCEKIAQQRLDGGEKIQIKPLTFEQFLNLSKKPSHHIAETVVDMLMARLSPKFNKKYKKALFG